MGENDCLSKYSFVVVLAVSYSIGAGSTFEVTLARGYHNYSKRIDARKVESVEPFGHPDFRNKEPESQTLKCGRRRPV